MSRRRLAALTASGSLAGALWTVGLAALSRSSAPTLMVLGDADWQVALLESGTDRILFLTGMFEESPEAAVGRLLSTLRQHIDVVVGTESGLRYLSRSGVLAQSLWVQLDAARDQADTPTFRALRHRLRVSFDGGQVDLERIPRREWDATAAGTSAWWIQLEVAELTVALAPDLGTAASVAPSGATLVIAPGGDAEILLRTLPGVAIAANGYGWDGKSEEKAIVPTFLVRTFPRDIAAFRFEDQGIMLPSWAQELLPPPRMP